MTPWITISPETVYDYLAAPQVEVLRHSTLAQQQTDPLPEIIRDICEQMRAEISAQPQNRLDRTAHTIPPHLKATACWLIIEAAQTRIPGLKATEDQIRLAEQARQRLQRIAQGELPLGQPDTVDTSGTYRRPGGRIDVLHGRPAQATGHSLSGF
ncbi:MAG: hypothetical protein LBD54_01440 [Puniceicoccales bacterium]|jgi:hypothetical protein|nr:hypothetical protein [Puniceicoccales bacterium]